MSVTVRRVNSGDDWIVLLGCSDSSAKDKESTNQMAHPSPNQGLPTRLVTCDLPNLYKNMLHYATATLFALS